MHRAITGFGIDDLGDPFAWLDCGHRQHVRHKPPFTNRPWVLSEQGRRGKLGALLNCRRCDRCEFPDGLQCDRCTPEFDQDSIPAGLLREHTTGAGVWGRIVVASGRLRYHVQGTETAFELAPGTPGIVPPQAVHRVEAVGPVRFAVEFWRAPAAPQAVRQGASHDE